MLRNIVLIVAISLLTGYCSYFPRQQGRLAFTLATGLGVPSLQSRIDALEEKAIRGEAFTEQDKAFLRDLYTCFAKGGRLTVVLAEPAAMMRHYLDGSGTPMRIEPRLFLRSAPVRERMAALRRRIGDDRAAGTLRDTYSSGTFYMNDQRQIDTFVALHFGELTARPSVDDAGALRLHWRAELPWQWPSYEWVFQRFGRYHAMSFPLPNARSLLHGPQHRLYIDDGLGEHLVELGLAKPFLVYAEWEEPADVSGP